MQHLGNENNGRCDATSGGVEMLAIEQPNRSASAAGIPIPNSGIHPSMVIRRVVRCARMSELKHRISMLDALTMEASQTVLTYYERTGEWLGAREVSEKFPAEIYELPTFQSVKGLVPIKSFRGALTQAVKLAKDPETDVYNAVWEYIGTKYRKTFARRLVESGLHVQNMPFGFELVGEIPSNAVIMKYEFVFDVDDVELGEDEAVLELTIIGFTQDKNDENLRAPTGR